MDLETYVAQLEGMVEDDGIEISPKTLERLAKRAIQLVQDEVSEDEIFDELAEVLPKKYADDEAVWEMLSQFSEFVIAELGNTDIQDEEE